MIQASARAVADVRKRNEKATGKAYAVLIMSWKNLTCCICVVTQTNLQQLSATGKEKILRPFFQPCSRRMRRLRPRLPRSTGMLVMLDKIGGSGLLQRNHYHLTQDNGFTLNQEMSKTDTPICCHYRFGHTKNQRRKHKTSPRALSLSKMGLRRCRW